MGIGVMWSIDLAVGAISAGLTAWLFTLYLRRAVDLKSRFSYGLTILSGIFFMESVVSMGVYYRFSETYSIGVALPLLVLGALGLVGFAVLLWIARQ
jgi:hypothetical protein